MGLKTQFRKFIWQTPWHNTYETRLEKRRQEREFQTWKSGPLTVPPHRIKQQALLEMAQKHDLRHLVETGTYMGEMIEAMRHHFESITSIELSTSLHQRASHRFQNLPSITLLCGDSGEMLKKIAPELRQPTLFWLDGHYSAGETAMGDKETPIFEELQHIFHQNDPGHVVLIDDAREFHDNPGYPPMDELMEKIKTLRPKAKISINNDSIFIEPPIS